MRPTESGEGYELFLADCRDVLPTIEAGRCRAVIIDPPYGINYQSQMRPRKEERHAKIANDKRPFLGWGDETRRVVSDDGSLLVFYRWDVYEPFARHLDETGWVIKSQVIWDKMTHGMGDLNGQFAPGHENIFFATKAGGRFSFPGRRPVSVLRHARTHPEAMIHPNEKPVSLLAELVCAVTEPGDTVLDFTMGSGVTGAAAVLAGRRFIGVELDEGHFANAADRIANAAGEYRAKQWERASGQLAMFDLWAG